MKIFSMKKLIAAAMLGAFTISIPMAADARIHDTKADTKSEMASGKRLPTLRERVAETMSKFRAPEGEKPFNAFGTPNTETSSFQDFSVPQTVSTYDTSIIGTPMATQQQCVKYLLRNNPHPNLKVSAEEIVAYYYEEGRREGIRPDVAFAQALKETGFFRYGGDVVPEQNNFCGLGTTGGGVRGEYFSTPQLGVRAHIQHLLAYSSTRRPTMPVVDPRYTIVRQAYGSRTLGTWQDLNGRWAVPGYRYGQEIMSMFRAILGQ